MPEPRKLRVFMCHASQDKPVVRDLCRQLRAAGWIEPWLDEEKLLPGQEWDLEIEKAVEHSDVVLVCLSSHSVDKEGYIQKELRFVLNIAETKPEGAIFVVPLRLDDCPVPRRLRIWQYVDYFPKGRRAWAFQRLLESLKLRAGRLGIPTLNLAEEPARREVEEKDSQEKGAKGVALGSSKGEEEKTPIRKKRNLLVFGIGGVVLLISLIAGLTYFIQHLPFIEPITGIDGMLMEIVPAGKFTMGNDSGDSDEKPAHEVDLDSFWIDQTEVTNAMYQLCVQAKKCNPPSDETYFGKEQYANYPVVYVSWNDASQYCTWAGRRLPTEAEWEKTARGVNHRVYPWGNEFSCQKGNFDDETKFDPYVVPGGPNCDGNEYLSPVGSYSSGKSHYGVLDMAGNVWEWVADWYSDTYYSNSPSMNPMGPASGKLRVLRGGSWSVSVNVVRSSNRYNFDPATSSSDIGFRCAMDATP